MKEKMLSCRNIFIGVLLALAVLLTALPSTAAAAVGMKVRAGLGGLYKVDQPLELLITVENDGPGFDGVIRVRLDDERQARPDFARYLLNVKVAADASQEFHMFIPGELAASMPLVELVSGDLVLSKSRVEGAAVGGSQVALALSEDILGSGLQAWLSGVPGTQMNLKYLSPGDLPVNSLAMCAADVMMIDSPGIVSFTGEQARAIKEWVQLGGVLVLFDGAGAGEGGLFEDVSPVRATGGKTVEGRMAGLRSGGPLHVATGELVAGRALVMENGVPVLARRDLGRGQVLFCGAAPRDLGMDARGVWATLLGASPGSGEKTSVVKTPSFQASENMLTNASSYIPRLAGPPIPVLSLLWLLYVAAVGPLLYFSLRRVDRRDWAWVLVPALALTGAGCFYLFAPANRLQGYLSQTLATVEIFSPELAEIRAGASVVASRGGDFTLQAGDRLYAMPARQYDGYNTAPPLVLQDGDKVNVQYNDVEYGSLRQAYTFGLKRGFGSIEGSLRFEGSSVKGDLINKTGLDFRDSRLLLGGRTVNIGKLPAGGTVHVEETLERWNSPANPEMLMLEMGGRDQPGDPFFRERQMLSQVLGGGYGMTGVQFLGWCDGSPGLFEVAGKGEPKEDYGLVLVKQTIKMDLARGKFSLPAGFITPRPAEPDPKAGYGPEGKTRREGTEVLVYDIGDAGAGNSLKVEAVSFQEMQGNPSCLAEIYNRRQDKWEPLPEGGSRINADELTQYMSDYKVLVRLTRMGDIRKPYPVWPGMAVEGEVS